MVFIGLKKIYEYVYETIMRESISDFLLATLCSFKSISYLFLATLVGSLSLKTTVIIFLWVKLMYLRESVGL